MIAYKGTNNFKCLNMTFKINQTYEINGELIMCKNGFHFCENLIDIHEFYQFIDKNTVVLEIEILGDIIKDGIKSVTNKMRILRIIPKTEYCKISPKNFDKNGNLIYWKNSYKYWVKYKYDKNNNMIYKKCSDKRWEKWQYDENNNCIYYETSYKYWKKCEYDKNNNEIYYEDSNGSWQKKKYDENNNKIYFEDSYGHWEGYKYNENGDEIYYTNSFMQMT